MKFRAVRCGNSRFHGAAKRFGRFGHKFPAVWTGSDGLDGSDAETLKMTDIYDDTTLMQCGAREAFDYAAAAARLSAACSGASPR